ncbi:hypothetical protein QBC34DRAFT_363971 [Podospora aff. communis PSN243]|uniref:Uncharacterized protein n=1 Tax=Podospora aff. communis PSN243 TaxID=3040156 RepID=A0AAV9FX41_9PEZI|nr:hypothetical protein QBC34DRAFT_363971 [Podospora aff. communis PSN243]
MPSITSIATFSALAGLFNVATAATQVKLNTGVCRTLPGAVPNVDKGSSWVGEVNLHAVGTGTHLDNLGPYWGSITETQRGLPAWETLALHNATGFARYNIGCQDETGLGTFYSGGQTIRINTDKDSTIVLNNYGLIPEPYSYYIDGAKQPGVYIGVAGEVNWAWSEASGTNGVTYWKPRLLVATESNPSGAQLRQGEVKGFIVAK